MLQLQKQVTAVIKEYNLFRANDTVLLGVSGGPDSVALLSLIFDANCINPTCSSIFIAHLNHLIRGKESEEDAQFVSDLAKKFKLSIVSERRDIKKIARERKMSLEEAWTVFTAILLFASVAALSLAVLTAVLMAACDLMASESAINSETPSPSAAPALAPSVDP